MRDLAFFVELLKSAASLWLGAYVLTRGGQQSRSQMMGAALVIWSLSPFGTAMMMVSAGDNLLFWPRLAVAAYPMMIALMGGVALSLLGDSVSAENANRLRRLYHAVIVFGIIVGLFAGFTNYMFDYSTVQTSADRNIYNQFAQFGPLEPLYAAFRLAVPLLLVILFGLVYRWADPARNRRGLLFLWLAAIVWLFGLTAQNILYSRDWLASSGVAVEEGFIFHHLTDPIFVVAIGLLGYGILQHNAIVRGRLVERDFWYSMGGAVVLIAAFGLLPWLLGRTIYAFDTPVSYFLILLATWVSVITHVGVGQTRRWVDRRLMGDVPSMLRDEMAETLQASIEGVSVADTLDELDQLRPKLLIHEHVNKQLLRALDSADGVDLLANSPLQALAIVQNELPDSPTDRQRAAAIHSLLTQGLVQLESAEASLHTRRQKELLQIMSLRLRDGLDRADITLRLHMHPRKYDRLLTDGIRQLADTILELEQYGPV